MQILDIHDILSSLEKTVEGTPVYIIEYGDPRDNEKFVVTRSISELCELFREYVIPEFSLKKDGCSVLCRHSSGWMPMSITVSPQRIDMIFEEIKQFFRRQ